MAWTGSSNPMAPTHGVAGKSATPSRAANGSPWGVLFTRRTVDVVHMADVSEADVAAFVFGNPAAQHLALRAYAETALDHLRGVSTEVGHRFSPLDHPPMTEHRVPTTASEFTPQPIEGAPRPDDTAFPWQGNRQDADRSPLSARAQEYRDI